MPEDPAKTTVRLPSTGQATVTGPATVDTEPGASIQVAGWYRSFEKYGFAGLTAFLFGWLIFNQVNFADKLLGQRESDMAVHEREIKGLADRFEKRLDAMQERSDRRYSEAQEKAEKRDERTRERLWTVLGQCRDYIKQIMQAMKIVPLPTELKGKV